MLYRFASKATANLTVSGPVGDEFLRIIGKDPAVAGTLSVAAMPAAIQALSDALAHARASGTSTAGGTPAAEEKDDDDTVTLRQRIWPFKQVLKCAYESHEPVVWTV